MAGVKAASREKRGAEENIHATALARREWKLVALLAMAVVGIAISIYLTTVHYAKIPLVCSTTGLINCAQVTSSAYSVIPGTSLPITIPGMLWFLVSGGFAVIGLRSALGMASEPTWLRRAHFGWSAAGLLFVLYLVYAEIVALGHICEWCTVVHILTLLTFLLALDRLQQGAQIQEPRRTTTARKPQGQTQRRR